MNTFQKRFAVIYKSRFGGTEKKLIFLSNHQVLRDIETFNL